MKSESVPKSGEPLNYFFYFDEDIYLRELRKSDLDGRWPHWLNDPEVTKFTKGFYPNTRESQEQYFESILSSKTDVVLAIMDRRTHSHLGNVGLHGIDYIHRTAQFGVMIGEKSAWGRGTGSKVWSLMVEYGFTVLNLHKITATVLDGNDASLKGALKAGFQIEGRQIEQVFKYGMYVDLIQLGILRKNFK
jgi:RimJ/RimL family protein N-acetyltransferase